MNFEELLKERVEKLKASNVVVKKSLRATIMDNYDYIENDLVKHAPPTMTREGVLTPYQTLVELLEEQGFVNVKLADIYKYISIERNKRNSADAKGLTDDDIDEAIQLLRDNGFTALNKNAFKKFLKTERVYRTANRVVVQPLAVPSEMKVVPQEHKAEKVLKATQEVKPIAVESVASMVEPKLEQSSSLDAIVRGSGDFFKQNGIDSARLPDLSNKDVMAEVSANVEEYPYLLEVGEMLMNVDMSTVPLLYKGKCRTIQDIYKRYTSK